MNGFAEPRSESIAERPVLPARYYLDHFHEFLAMIEELYLPVLEAEHLALVEDFRALDADAQCLWVRMLNRQGRVFHRRRFRYAEIHDIDSALDQLHRARFLRPPIAADFTNWLTVLSRDALLELLPKLVSTDRYRRSWPKGQLLSFAASSIDPRHPVVAEAMADYVIQDREDAVGYLLFLYFGRREAGLSRFTLRDLGVVRAARFRRRFTPRFTDRDCALSSWFYCRKLHEVQALDADALAPAVAELPAWPAAADDEAEQLRQRAIYHLGEMAERGGDGALAESVYSHATGWPASERRVRLAWARGDRERAEAMLESMIDDPSGEEELLFAQDFQARKLGRKRTAIITDLLRDGPSRRIDESYRDMPEEGVADWYRARGAQVFHSENRLWKRLFGLLFWELLFNRESAALHNDFEKRPRDLDSGAFYPRNRDAIEELLSAFDDTAGMERCLVNTMAREYGKPNSIFRWSPDMLEPLQAFLRAVPGQGLAEIMRRMAREYSGNRSGYPDLMVIENGVGRFVEVKAEGDQLRRNQLKQITALRQAEIPVEVNRVEWAVDPDQRYVVVDIETTGRRGGNNRVTEIGAVRLRGNRIEDTWETLVNPDRAIPRMITGLTGITDAMVADAPRFAGIADHFRDFTEGCIFVAHNVRFDYGFLCDEYRRLEQDYHRPTFCSVAGMRRWFPGLRSYSLGNLCAEFDIPLEDHHRALCDARAAAELLLRINERRLAS